MLVSNSKLVSKEKKSSTKYGQVNFNSILSLLILTLILFLTVGKLSAQTNDDCLTCHSDSTLTMKKKGKVISLFIDAKVLAHSAHQKLQCISCHVGFNPDNDPHKKDIEPIDCKSCHKDAAVLHPFHPQMMKLKGVSDKPDLNCKGCHGTHDIISPKVPGSKFYITNMVNACGSCHKDKKAEFETSAHANGLREGIKGSPNCYTCHRNPIVSANTLTDSTEIKIAQEKLCISCHLDNQEIRSRTSPSAGFINSYEQSVHGKALLGGNGKAANCVNCHTAHKVKPASDPTSTVNRFNVPNTCGHCHSSIASDYKQSVHGVAILQKGNLDAPVCTTCHGEHNILNPNNPSSPTAYANVSQEICSKCHSSVTLSAKYGLNPNRWSTFKDSYHGLAMQGGATIVANCASCHTAHNVLPPSDPRSSVYKGNLSKTCGRCHPGANEKFAGGNIHSTTTNKKSEPILYWIAAIYIAMILSVIGAMLLHNILDFIKKARIKKLKQMGMLIHKKPGHSLYLRMTVNERIQHILLSISFIVLVITGFMLQFPNTWWVSHIRSLSENTFIYRGILHRIAAIIMILVSLYHLYYILFTARGRQLVKDLLPKRQDFSDAIGVAKFNLGLSKTKPKLDRFSYVEKTEYWALIWGTIVMSATGLIMWFYYTLFIGWFSLLGWDIARTIHYYEAWLATLAIIVWHFYFVIFSPDIYPMNLSWIIGHLTEEEMEDEHPAELEKLNAQQSEDEENNSK